MLAKDIMVENVITVTKETAVKDAAKLLTEHKISGIPVVDSEKRLVGIITEGDLLYQGKKFHTPAFIELLGGVIFLENPYRFDQDLKKMTATRVENIMTSKVHTVKEDTPLDEIATIMVEREVNRVPVVDHSGKLVGIVSRQDLIRAMV
jgi:CBS domain-containing protein